MVATTSQPGRTIICGQVGRAEETVNIEPSASAISDRLLDGHVDGTMEPAVILTAFVTDWNIGWVCCLPGLNPALAVAARSHRRS